MRFEDQLYFYGFMYKLLIYNESLFNKSLRLVHHL